MESQYISFWKDDVTLSLWLEDDLTPCKHKFADITVSTSRLADKDVYWDCLEYFINVDKKTFKKECKPDLKDLDLSWKDVYKDIKYLIAKAKRLGYIL